MVSSEKYDNGIKGILPVIVVADDYVPESIFTFQIVNEVYWIGVPGISVKISGLSDFGEKINEMGVTNESGIAIFPGLEHGNFFNYITPGDYTFTILGNDEYKAIPERAEFKYHFFEGKHHYYQSFPITRLSNLVVKNGSTTANEEFSFKLQLKGDPFYTDGALAFTEGKWKIYDSVNNVIESGKIRNYTDYYYSFDVGEIIEQEKLHQEYMDAIHYNNQSNSDSNDGKIQNFDDKNRVADLMFLRSSGETDFKLKGGESIVFLDLPENVEFTITQTDSNETRTGVITAGTVNEVSF